MNFIKQELYTADLRAPDPNRPGQKAYLKISFTAPVGCPFERKLQLVKESMDEWGIDLFSVTFEKCEIIGIHYNGLIMTYIPVAIPEGI